MSTELDLERLSASVKHSLQENSVVIFRVPLSQVSKTMLSLKPFDETFKHYNIAALICCDDIEVIVVPPGSSFEIDKRAIKQEGIKSE